MSVRRWLAALGLADLLVGGGALVASTGAVLVFGWPIALLGLGTVALAGGVAMARSERRRAR